MRLIRRAFPLIAFLLVLFAQEARPKTTNTTVTAVDDRITYIGEWTVQENGIRKFTSIPGSLALNFTGNAIHWYSRRLWTGALVEIILDDDAVVSLDLSNGIGQNDTPVVEVLYEKEGLDASENHYFNVTWAGEGLNEVGTFLENYRILYTSEGSTSSSSPSPSSSSTSSSVGTSAKPNTGAIAGGVVGGVLGVLLVVAVTLLCLRRRDTRAASRRDMQSATPFPLAGNPPPGPPSDIVSSLASMKRNMYHSESASRNEGGTNRSAPHPPVHTDTYDGAVHNAVSEQAARMPALSTRRPGTTSYPDELQEPPPLYTN